MHHLPPGQDGCLQAIGCVLTDSGSDGSLDSSSILGIFTETTCLAQADFAGLKALEIPETPPNPQLEEASRNSETVHFVS